MPDPALPLPTRPRRLLRTALVAIAYLLGGVVSVAAGLVTSGPSGQSSVVWLPPGIAVAALLVWGRSIWPGLLASALCLDWLMAMHEAPRAGFEIIAILAVLIAVAGLLQYLATRALVHRFAGKNVTLDRPKAVLGFLLCSAVTSLISSTAGSLALVAFGIRPLQTLLADNSSWWISDTLSVFLITPVVLSWIGAPSHVWRPRRFQLTIPLLVALVLMAAAFVQAKHLEADREQRNFQLRANHLTSAMQHRIEEITHDVNALRDVQEMTPSTSETQFRAFATRLRSRNAVVTSLVWVPVVSIALREQHQVEMRRGGYPSYAIRDLNGGDLAMPARGDLFFPIQFGEPADLVQTVVGHDYGSDPVRRGVLEEAARTRAVAVTPPVNLLGAGRRRGFVMAVAVQAGSSGATGMQSAKGFVVSALLVAPMVRDSMGPGDEGDLDVRIDDRAVTGDDGLLYATAGRGVPEERLPYHSVGEIDVHGHRWRLTVKPTDTYLRANRSGLLPAVSVTGLLFATLLCGFLLVTTGNAANTRQLIIERTGDLSRANDQLREEITIHQRMEEALKKSEHELAGHRERLEEQVLKRTAELEVAKAAAEKANRAKSAFLANMSHELRTPMHAVLAYARLLLDNALAPKLEGFAERIVQSGERLLALLNDLLDLSKLEAGKMRADFAPHDLQQVVGEVAQEMEPLLAKKGLSLRMDTGASPDDFVADVDRAQVGQVFRNILANAVRFSAQGGHLTVRLAGVELPGVAGGAPRAALEIAFSDEGIGIPPSELDAIFDKFVQSSKTRTDAGGTGLGLAICKQIAELHGGRIIARNNDGAGATFVLTIPRRAHKRHNTNRELAA